MATVNAGRLGSRTALKVTRNAVAFGRGRTLNSTRSAAAPLEPGPVGGRGRGGRQPPHGGPPRTSPDARRPPTHPPPPPPQPTSRAQSLPHQSIQLSTARRQDTASRSAGLRGGPRVWAESAGLAG